MTLSLVKGGTSQKVPWEARTAWNETETTPNKRNKEKPSSLSATSDIDRSSMVSDRVIKHSFDSGQRNEIQLKQQWVLQENLYCLKSSLLKWLHHGCSEFAELLYIIDCIAKWWFFLMMPNICFHDAQISWKNVFHSVSKEFLWL